MSKHTRSSSLLFVTLLLITTASRAHAYVDGGSASMAWQIVVASSLGVVFVIRGFWSNLVAKFKRKPSAAKYNNKENDNRSAS